MDNNFEITVKDVLERETFQRAKILAGAGGIDRRIKWTHILETKEFESLINGGELILTTGIGFNKEKPVNFYERLIHKNVAGICIEKGEHFKDISSEVKQLADKHHFPIIVFESIVKFVDITHDLHTLIINQHHHKITKLNELTKTFTELSLSPNGALKILKEMYFYFDQDVMFISEEKKSYYYPPETKQLADSIQRNLKSMNLNKKKYTHINMWNTNFTFYPVRGLGQVWGYLCLETSERLKDEFTYSVLDTAALAIAQITLRNRTLEERRLNQEDKNVRSLLQGENIDTDSFQLFFPDTKESTSYRVILIQEIKPESQNDDDWSEIKIQQSLIIKREFKKAGFFPVVSIKKNEIAIICSCTASSQQIKDTEAYSKVIHNILDINEKDIWDGAKYTIGVSRKLEDISRVPQGYKQAMEVLRLHKSGILQTYFYEKIGIYRILLWQDKEEKLDAYINDYLGPIIAYDQKNNSSLLETLAVFLECGFSKKKASEKLFIVRQTLYYRLAKIDELLGYNLLESSDRLAVETAIKAYYLNKVKA
ncbi:PucR family transcriptional regulator [Virgibacillus ihumii]|uniref:PucR family transcriptional regulator n=1 Tax=Virgibacillus ihumii TaxID=2686091 RepID=UPI001FEB51D1|nr:PucR family transcriptional regulator [Virgibacillus ihumii]